MAIDPTPFYEDIPSHGYGGLCLTLEQWVARDILKKDLLLGEVFSTTTRAMLSAPTGLGKTHLAVAIGISMAACADFCHWKVHRPARVLVVDGEMPRELIQERLGDAARRLGSQPEGFHCLSREDVEGMPPLDTLEGQAWVNGLIGTLNPLDFIILDNLMALTVSDLKDEDGWKMIQPWNLSLTKRHIGSLWINHTGIDKTRDYGTSTRQWQLDTAMLLTKLDEHPADIAFRLDFTKARQRKPSNRDDYDPVNLILEDDAWRTEPAEPLGRTGRLGKNEKTMLDILAEHMPTGLSQEEWNRLSREDGIGVKRRADLADCRRTLHAKKRIYQGPSEKWFVKTV